MLTADLRARGAFYESLPRARSCFRRLWWTNIHCAEECCLSSFVDVVQIAIICGWSRWLEIRGGQKNLGSTEKPCVSKEIEQIEVPRQSGNRWEDEGSIEWCQKNFLERRARISYPFSTKVSAKRRNPISQKVRVEGTWLTQKEVIITN